MGMSAPMEIFEGSLRIVHLRECCRDSTLRTLTARDGGPGASAAAAISVRPSMPSKPPVRAGPYTSSPANPPNAPIALAANPWRKLPPCATDNAPPTIPWIPALTMPNALRFAEKPDSSRDQCRRPPNNETAHYNETAHNAGLINHPELSLSYARRRYREPGTLLP
jgi:hypothetical protein